MNPPPPLSADVKSEMMDEDSRLFMDLCKEMAVYGVELTLEWLKVECFSRGYSFLKSKSCEIDKEEFVDLLELLSVGDIFLQNCADLAMEMGGDPVAIKNVVGVFPREAGGMSLSDDYIQQPHTQTKDAEPCSNTFLCNGQEPQKEPQGSDKSNTLIVVPNEPQRAAQGQQIGNNEPQPIPKELDNDEAKTYFKKAVELGLMTDDFRWLKGLQMLSCFAREMSLKYNLGKGERISWKPFETLFGVPKGKLRLNYNDIQKTGQNPSEAYLIDKIF